MSRRRRRAGLAALLALCGAVAAPARAQDMPEYRDDRSTPRALVESLYNAIGRHEYLRAWSYHEEGAVAGFDAFAQGYAQTASVTVRAGDGTLEGAAGTLYALVPAVVEATDANGRVTVFEGCYETRQVQPAAQGQPPFQPIRITAARLTETSDDFVDAVGACPAEGL